MKEEKKKRVMSVTLKQTKLLRLIPATKSIKEASILAGYSPKTSTGQIINQSPYLKQGLQELLEKNELGLNQTLRRLKVITKAGMTRKALKETTIDNSLKAIDTTLKLHKVIDTNNTLNIQNNSYTVQLQSLTDTELEAEYVKLSSSSTQ